MRPIKYSAPVIAAFALLGGPKAPVSASPYYNYDSYDTIENAVNTPAPGQAVGVAAAGARDNVGAGNELGVVKAGDKYVTPEAVNPEGSRNGIYSEYNYIDTGTDTAGIGTVGSANVYSFGYERTLTDTIFLNLSYEYNDDDLRPAGGGAVEIDTHTVAGALSAVITNNIYGMIIVGGSFSDGGTNLNGVQLAGAEG